MRKLKVRDRIIQINSNKIWIKTVFVNFSAIKNKAHLKGDLEYSYMILLRGNVSNWYAH